MPEERQECEISRDEAGPCSTNELLNTTNNPERVLGGIGSKTGHDSRSNRAKNTKHEQKSQRKYAVTNPLHVHLGPGPETQIGPLAVSLKLRTEVEVRTRHRVFSLVFMSWFGWGGWKATFCRKAQGANR